MSVIALLGCHIFQTLTARQTVHNCTTRFLCGVVNLREDATTRLSRVVQPALWIGTGT